MINFFPYIKINLYTLEAFYLIFASWFEIIRRF